MPLPNHCIDCNKPTTNRGLCDKCKNIPEKVSLLKELNDIYDDIFKEGDK